MLRKTKRFIEGGVHYELTARYGWHKIGEQPPYLSVTGELWEVYQSGRYQGQRKGSDCVACGMLHEEIAQHFPELRPLLPFHLASVPGVPMHYLANAAFWYDKLAGRSAFRAHSYDPPAIEAFKSTIAYGTIEGDDACPLPLLVNGEPHPEGGDMRQPFTPEELRAWLEGRLPRLVAECQARSEAAGVPAPIE